MITARNKRLNTDEIKIPSAFLEHPPRRAKWEKAEAEWRKTGKLGKIYVDSHNVLVDGYIQYLIAAHNNIEYVRGVVLWVKKCRPNGGVTPKVLPDAPEKPELARKKPPQPYGIQLGKIHITFTKTR
jgi:hypothetical protein